MAAASSPDNKPSAPARAPKARARSGGGRSNGSVDGDRARRRDAEVLAAATKVFYAKSYADSSVQDVADELGILKGSLYHYIKTKEDLLDWLVQDVHDDVSVILKEVQEAKDLAPLDRLELYVRKQVLYNARNLARITVYHHDSDQLSPVPRKALRMRQRHNEQVLIDLITEAQERGEVSPDLDARVLTNCVLATLIWMYRWYNPNGRIKSAELADICAEYAMAGLRGAGRRTPASDDAAS